MFTVLPSGKTRKRECKACQTSVKTQNILWIYSKPTNKKGPEGPLFESL